MTDIIAKIITQICSYETILEEWCTNNKHQENCYQTELSNKENEWIKENPEPSFIKESLKEWRIWSNKRFEIRDKIYQELTKKYNVIFVIKYLFYFWLFTLPITLK